MKKFLLPFSLLTLIVLSGCSSHSIRSFEPFQAQDLNGFVKSGRYKQKIDTLFVINDSSSSMSEQYLGSGFSSTDLTKHSVEKELLSRMNHTIPSVKLDSGLRSFGFGPCLSWGFTHLNQPVQAYSQAGFDSAIRSLNCSSGGTPVNEALQSAAGDLQAAKGNIAVILLSDGNNYDSHPANDVKHLKQLYADRLCFYTIWVGNEKDKPGKAVLDQLPRTAGCGFSTSAESVASSQGMASFVEKVMFNLAEPVKFEADADKDGVIDSKDGCPGTPYGATVNSQGCWIIKGVLFDTDKSDIKPAYHTILRSVVKVINQNPKLKFEIQGHTDNQGSAAYNLKLSERRAQSVKGFLESRVLRKGALTAQGYGLTRPVDSNDTEHGRQNNRRVQINVVD